MVTVFMEGAKLDQASLHSFKSSLLAKVLTPDDPGYDQARMTWNVAFQQRPALIVQARSAADIAQSVCFAQAEGLGVAVQSTGHGVIQPADGCLLIVTSQMNEVRVDPETRTAWVAAGAKWGAVLQAAQAHGLAPLLGSSPTVGAVGYTLGGGMGWLVRKYGLAADSVLSFELVNAEGEMLNASPDENFELFWALRGGGKGLGIVTAMHIRLYPVSQVFGGSLIYPVELAGEAFRRYRQWIAAMPEEMTTSIKIANFPPVEAVPEFFRGRSFVMVNGCYCGPLEKGPGFIQGWLDWQAPLANSFHIMPFSEVAVISSDPVDPMPAQVSGAWLASLEDQAIDTIVRFAAPFTIVEVRHVSGAMGRVPAGFNAFGQRGNDFVMETIAFTPTPEIGARVRGYSAQFKAALAPHLAPGVYMNFLEGEEARQNTREAFSPGDFRRLAALKAQLDPQNIFRSGYDFQPAA
jgi:FAD/FMN-containing dehydrogenase